MAKKDGELAHCESAMTDPVLFACAQLRQRPPQIRDVKDRVVSKSVGSSAFFKNRPGAFPDDRLHRPVGKGQRGGANKSRGTLAGTNSASSLKLPQQFFDPIAVRCFTACPPV